MTKAVVETVVQLSHIGGPVMAAKTLNDFVVQAHLSGGSGNDPRVCIECLETRAEEEGLLAELETPQKLGYFNSGANPAPKKNQAGSIPQLGSQGPKKVGIIRPIVRIFHEVHSASSNQSMHLRRSGVHALGKKYKDFHDGKFF